MSLGGFSWFALGDLACPFPGESVREARIDIHTEFGEEFARC